MRWYVINSLDGEVEYECDDDIEGVNNVIKYLTANDSRFEDQGEITREEMIVIRGERMQLIPPTGDYRLVNY